MVRLEVLLMDALTLSLARTTDPATSKKGAADVRPRAGSQKAVLLRAFALAGPHGLTDEEAGYVSHLADDPRCGYWKRCSELRAAGLIAPTGEERTGRTGSAQAVHALTELGRLANEGGH
jgi:hypothetical protein